MEASMPETPYAEICFYIVAHADDWQLFMQPNVYNDLVTSGSKVVYIITTAGDAGGDKTYWNAREEGLKSSVRFCIAPFAPITEANGTRELNNHKIMWWSVSNAICYFLRLPDGNLDGKGFPAYNYQSLSKLIGGEISTISAIDNSAWYQSWSDFLTTLQTIISIESYGISSIWINYLNPDINANPNDHPDHIATGQAIQSMTAISNMSQALFVGYNVRNNSQKLDGAELFWKAGMLAAYEKAVFDYSGYSTLRESINTYIEWCLSRAKFITDNT